MAAQILGIATSKAAISARAARVRLDVKTPADLFGELFVDVQMGRVFPDSKTFVDCLAKDEPERVLEAYRERRDKAGFDLKAFVQEHFDPPEVHDSQYVSRPEQSLADHIDGLWAVLTRQPEKQVPHSSLLPLPHPYVVPGGRFGELYYWDSYFTMLGLMESGRRDLLRAMADNFAYLIDTYGHIPNGTRTYYLSRSQPPLFAMMVELFERHGVQPALRYLTQLQQEYAYWMDGADALKPGCAHRHAVCLEGGLHLNRYWDDRDTPREESFLEDVTTARESQRPAREVYRDLRAAAASGWDFSSRWQAQADRLSSIRTTAILPVDLNAFLYQLERTIARLCEAAGDGLAVEEFGGRAKRRARAIHELMWDEQAGAFVDYDWGEGRRRSNVTAATLCPLFVGLATPEQATRMAQMVRARLLREGGIATTENESGEQWDQPNGWAPLQWIAIQGLTDYRETELADLIAHRWLETVSALYRRESKLVEKYALHNAEGGSGGEYPLQDGFGWSNGVARKLLDLYPEHAAHQCRARCGQ